MYNYRPCFIICILLLGCDLVSCSACNKPDVPKEERSTGSSQPPSGKDPSSASSPTQAGEESASADTQEAGVPNCSRQEPLQPPSGKNPSSASSPTQAGEESASADTQEPAVPNCSPQEPLQPPSGKNPSSASSPTQAGEESASADTQEAAVPNCSPQEPLQLLTGKDPSSASSPTQAGEESASADTQEPAVPNCSPQEPLQPPSGKNPSSASSPTQAGEESASADTQEPAVPNCSPQEPLQLLTGKDPSSASSPTQAGEESASADTQEADVPNCSPQEPLQPPSGKNPSSASSPTQAGEESASAGTQESGVPNCSPQEPLQLLTGKDPSSASLPTQAGGESVLAGIPKAVVPNCSPQEPLQLLTGKDPSSASLPTQAGEESASAGTQESGVPNCSPQEPLQLLTGKDPSSASLPTQAGGESVLAGIPKAVVPNCSPQEPLQLLTGKDPSSASLPTQAGGESVLAGIPKADVPNCSLQEPFQIPPDKDLSLASSPAQAGGKDTSAGTKEQHELSPPNQGLSPGLVPTPQPTSLPDLAQPTYVVDLGDLNEATETAKPFTPMRPRETMLQGLRTFRTRDIDLMKSRAELESNPVKKLEMDVKIHLEDCESNPEFNTQRENFFAIREKLKQEPGNKYLQKIFQQQLYTFQDHPLYKESVQLGMEAAKLRYNAAEQASYSNIQANTIISGKLLHDSTEAQKAKTYQGQADIIKANVLKPLRDNLGRPDTPSTGRRLVQCIKVFGKNLYASREHVLADAAVFLEQLEVKGAKSLIKWKNKLGIRGGRTKGLAGIDFKAGGDMLSTIANEIELFIDDPKAYEVRDRAMREEYKKQDLFRRAFDARNYYLEQDEVLGNITAGFTQLYLAIQNSNRLEQRLGKGVGRWGQLVVEEALRTDDLEQKGLDGLSMEGIEPGKRLLLIDTIPQEVISDIEQFIASANKVSGQSKDGLSKAANALHKYTVRERGAFSNVKFSYKTANQTAERVLRDIMNASTKLMERTEEDGSTIIYDIGTKRGFRVSEKGLFKGFRVLK